MPTVLSGLVSQTIRPVPNDLVVLAEGGMIAVPGGVGVDATERFFELRILGTIAARNGIDTANGASSTGTTAQTFGSRVIIVDDAGQVVAQAHGIRLGDAGNFAYVRGQVLSNYSGVTVKGEGNRIHVDGQVSAAHTGITASGAHTDILVSGQVVGQSRGIRVDRKYANIDVSGEVHGGDKGILMAAGSGSSTVHISGVVSGVWDGLCSYRARNISIEVDYGGALQGRNGIDMTGDSYKPTSNEIVNHGKIQGASFGILSSKVTQLTIRNDGAIASSSEGGAAILFHGPGTLDLTNKGLIVGDIRTEDEGSGFRRNADFILNSGEVRGAIRLGVGDDWYRGTGPGQVTEGVFGDAGDDTLVGSAAGDLLTGGADDDVLRGRDGKDSLIGGEGDDLIAGGAGKDKVWGGDGSDTIRAGAGNDTVRGGGGADDVHLAGGDDVFVDDADDRAGGDDTVFAGDGHDLVIMKGGNDRVKAGAGDDTVLGGAGQDRLEGRTGKDSLSGEAGDDHLDGGGGQDTLDGGHGRDTLVGGAGDDVLSGGAAADVFVFGPDDGSDLILDFQDGRDRIDLSALGLSGFAALGVPGAIRDLGGDALIDLSRVGGSGAVVLTGLNALDLDATDFLF